MRAIVLLSMFALPLSLASFGFHGVPAAHAAPVRGKVVLDKASASGRRFRGYWRLENGMVPTSPPPKGDTVVVLSGVKGDKQPARTITVDLAGLKATPSTVVVGQNSVIEFKNSDSVAHDLEIVDKPDLMPIQRLAPGALRRQRFPQAGGFTVENAQYPHVVISVLVVETPHFDIVDEKGGFRIADVPDGKATLRVWAGGGFAHEQEINVGPDTPLTIRVRRPGSAATARDDDGSDADADSDEKE